MTNWYFEPENNQQILILSTCTIVNPYLGVSAVSYVSDTPKSVFNSNQSIISITTFQKFLTDVDHYYILY